MHGERRYEETAVFVGFRWNFNRNHYPQSSCSGLFIPRGSAAGVRLLATASSTNDLKSQLDEYSGSAKQLAELLSFASEIAYDADIPAQVNVVESKPNEPQNILAIDIGGTRTKLMVARQWSDVVSTSLEDIVKNSNMHILPPIESSVLWAERDDVSSDTSNIYDTKVCEPSQLIKCILQVVVHVSSIYPRRSHNESSGTYASTFPSIYTTPISTESSSPSQGGY
eukprot:1132167-Amorphochlora_amoeboformis.AAC.2